MHEECAVFGIKSTEDVFDAIYYGLYALQHRGQESAGIAVHSDKIRLHKDMGLVSEVFRNTYIEGPVGIGHVRYSTEGGSNIENAQPLLINYSKGSFAIAHNGHIVNYGELRSILENRGNIFTTTTDTEIVAHLIVQEHIRAGNIIDGIKRAMNYLEGAYSVVMLYDGKLIAFRDPHGVRPLVLGKSSKGEYVVASESCALDILEFDFVRDVRPSEILVVDDKVSSYSGASKRVAHCMFEYVYFARPDSILDGISVYDARKNLGKVLSEEGPVKADMVTAVPDSGVTTAIGYAEASGIRYGESLMKNRYVGRTFIFPTQEQRDLGVKIKLNPISTEIKGKDIVLVDDSIVRGTTIRKLIKLIKDAGAKKVHVRISCPPLKFTCHYGTDIQDKEQLIAAKKSVKEIQKMIGADSLVYTSYGGLIKAIGLPEERLCTACVSGRYTVSKAQTKLTEAECI